MFALFKPRTLLLLLGFVLIAVFIWYAGPLFAFAAYRPLDSITARLIAIGLVLGLWLASVLLARFRAFRASGQLVSAVLKQPHADEGRPSAEAAKLRERFEEAVATLQQQHRQSGQTLYDLPWYVIIGAPGSGKTTALLNSGLKFPLESRVGKAALRGVGGTRNCDWWFTDEAVFLDTAGRYTTQDSDAASDSEGWNEFLALLRKYRGRRPINGVILTVSAQDLMVQGDSEREAHVDAARRRLRELNRELGVQLPVYLMVTKCDLVAGFTEYFEDFAADARAQVWGVTFPYEQTLQGQASRAFPEELDRLVGRLNAALFAHIEEDRNGPRRTTVFAFPQQMAALRDLLAPFIDEVCEPARAEQPVLLRGVYFTSGTQEGTPIDRLLGAIGRRFGVASEMVASPTGRGKAYFVERLLKEVLIGESGLAGVNRQLEMRKAAVQLGAYAAMALLAIVGVIALSVSYGRNRAYVADVAAAVSTLNQVPAVREGAPLDQVVPRLDAVRAVVDSADRYRAATPWLMRWGLYQGTAVGNSARDAYVRELDALVLPRFAARINERLQASRSQPEKIYEYLKAYLMLSDRKHLDKPYLQSIADLEWNAANGTAALAKHFHSLLEYSDALRPIALDTTLIAQARTSVRQASVPVLMYERIKRRYAGDGRVVRLDVGAGVGADRVLRRKSGVKLSAPVPALYGSPVFHDVVKAGMADIVKQLAEDAWVWGDSGAPIGNTARLAADVIDVYERDYIAAWDAILDDLEIGSFATVREMSDALGMLAAPTSPLRGLLQVVVENTSLIGAAPGAAAQPGVLSSAANAVTDKLGQILKSAQEATGTATRPPGALVAAHFEPIHRLMAGAPGSAPIDGILAQFVQIQQQLKAMGPEIGGTDPIQALSSPALRGLLQSVQETATTMAPAVGALVAQIGHRAAGSVLSRAGNDLEARYRQQVLAPCAAAIDGRYPFEAGSSNDVLLADFARVFGPGGLFDTFFTGNNLERLVDDQKGAWTWRAGAEGLSRGMLIQLEAAHRLREMFFLRGPEPQIGFTITMAEVDAAARRFVLEVDNQVADNVHGALRRWPTRWPASTPGMAAATFEEVGGVWPPVKFPGPWALFRLIDAGQWQRESDQRIVLTFQNSSHRARVFIEPESIRNPFTNRDWQRFRCGA